MVHGPCTTPSHQTPHTLPLHTTPACSGIHREFSHRVKSISLSTFSLEEVKHLKEGGNEACARWVRSARPSPAMNVHTVRTNQDPSLPLA